MLQDHLLFCSQHFFGAVPTNKTFLRNVLKHRLVLSVENRVSFKDAYASEPEKDISTHCRWHRYQVTAKLWWWKIRKIFRQHRFSLTNWREKTESKSAKNVRLQLHQLQMVSHSSPDVTNEVLRLPTVSERLWKASKVCPVFEFSSEKKYSSLENLSP